MMKLIHHVVLAAGLIDLIMVLVQVLQGPVDVTLTIMGAVVADETIYAGLASLGILAVLYGGWPIVQMRRASRAAARTMAVEARAKAARDEATRAERFREFVIDMLLYIRDQGALGGFLAPYPEEARETYRIYQRKLRELGLGLPPGIRDDPHEWGQHAERLLPHVRFSGIDRAREELQAGRIRSNLPP